MALQVAGTAAGHFPHGVPTTQWAMGNAQETFDMLCEWHSATPVELIQTFFHNILYSIIIIQTKWLYIQVDIGLMSHRLQVDGYQN